MPNLAKPGAQRASERSMRRSDNSYLRNFKDERTLVRFLWEDPDRVWATFYYHFHWAKKVSYPCMMRELADDGSVIHYCLGCAWPADESLDEDARKKDTDWRVRARNYGIAVPALTIRDVDGETKAYLDLYQMGVGLKKDMATLFAENGSITTRDILVVRGETDGGKTKYTPLERGDATDEGRRFVAELRALYHECIGGMSAPPDSPAYSAAWDRWRAGNIALGLPDLNQVLARKYAEAAEAYGVSPEELAERNAAATEEAAESGRKADALRERAAAPAAPVADSNALESTPAAPAAPTAPAAEPAPAPAAPAASNGNGHGQPGQAPDFTTWITSDIRDWLREHAVEYPENAPRSVLIKTAERAAIGY